jgi:hypothetical protein
VFKTSEAFGATLEETGKFSNKVVIAAAVVASMNMGTFGQAYTVEPQAAPHASAHQKTTRDGGNKEPKYASFRWIDRVLA